MQALYTTLLFLLFIFFLRLLFRKTLDLPTYKGQLFSENFNTDNLMPEQKFWQIIEETKKKSNHHYQIQCQLLTEQLFNLSKDEITQFHRTFYFLMAKSYSFNVWEAVYSLNGGSSDDGFEFFRSWLIAQGRNKFYWTIKYPRLLFLVGVKELVENYEGVAYCAYDAYLKKTGSEIPQINDIDYVDGGKMFKEGEAFLRYPELALLAW